MVFKMAASFELTVNFRLSLPHFFPPKERKTVRKTVREKPREKPEPQHEIWLEGPNALSRISVSGFSCCGMGEKNAGNPKIN